MEKTIINDFLHVMHYNDIAVDYGWSPVRFRYDGSLPDENDFIVLEAMSICPHLTMNKGHFIYLT
jgi:hypothetical protein